MSKNTTHIVQKCLAGDSLAQRELYELYRVRWYMTSLRYGKSRYEADDILQEGMINIFKDLHQYDSNKGQFSTWSNRLIVNAALRYLKKNSWQNEFMDIDNAYDLSSEDSTIYDDMSMKELTLILQKLPMGYRIVFNMYAMEGYTHREIASELGISVGASKSQLSKARGKLRSILESHFINS